MHMSLSWMLGEEEGLSRDLNGRSSGRWSNECSRAVRRGGSDDLSSDESEFLRKETERKGGMDAVADYKAPNAIYRREKGGETVPWRGEMVNDEWSYSMLLFWEGERKEQHLIQKGKGACEATLGSRTVVCGGG
jgi:hypothetical protein